MERVERVGIALAFYNPSMKHFKQQLKSIVDQEFNSWTLMVTVDSDESNVLEEEEIKNLLSDERVVVHLNNERKGYPGNFVEAVRLLIKEGNIQAIAFSDQDDVWRGDKLSMFVDVMNKQTIPTLIHSDASIEFETDSRKIDSLWEHEKRNVEHSETEDVLVRNICAGATSMIHIELIKDNYELPEGITYHDHWYAILASAKGRIVSIPEKLNVYWQHGDNVLGTSSYAGLVSSSDLGKNAFQRMYKRYETVFNSSKALSKISSLGLMERVRLLQKWDLGILSVLKSFKYLFNDPALARAYISFGVGKFLSFFR